MRLDIRRGCLPPPREIFLLKEKKKIEEAFIKRGQGRQLWKKETAENSIELPCPSSSTRSRERQSLARRAATGFLFRTGT